MAVRFLEDLNVNGAVKISDGLSAGTPLLDLHNSTNGAGAQIRFTDVAAGTSQLGSIIYRHQDSKSYGSAASFEIGSAESSTTILANGKLMYSEGIYSKPSTGTGAGTRKDSNWDTAYGWGNHSTQGYLTAETNVFLGDGGNLLTAPGYNKLIFTGQISSGVSGLFPASDNSNSVITLNRHNGNYDSQLGFSSNGNVYYRKFSNTAINTTQGWGQLLITDTNGNIVPPGTVDGVDIAARDAVLTSTTTTANAALPKTGGTMTGTLKAATLEGASFTNRFRKMSVLPGGYIEPNALNFRFDESQTAYAGESHGIGGTINQTSGTTIPDASLKRLFTFTSSYINLNTYKDASNNVVIELTNIALSNSANTSWRPYVFFHSAAGNVASMTVELKDGDNNWETVENAIDCVDFYMYNGFYTLSPGILRGARFTFTNITGNSYLRMIGVIGKTVEPYQWNVLKSGSKMFGDLDFADSKKATFGNSDDLYLLHDGSHSYISQGGTGNLYIQQNTNDADMIFQCDNGSGGTSIYMMLDGSESRISTKVNNRFDDNVKLELGTSGDLDLLHDGSNSYIHHNGAGSLYMKADTGDINIINYTNDRDIILQSDDGSGGVTPYLTLDGSTTHSYFSAGNVGIGTTSPAYKLDVSSGSAVGARISTSGFTNLDLVSSRTSGNLGGVRFKQDIDAHQTAEFLGLHGGGFEWKTGNGTASPSSKMILNTSGNVGIGTTSPDANLHVNGTFIVAEDSEKGLDINTQTYNYKIGDIDAGESQTYIEIDSANAKTTLHNSTLELGHASDTTIARASAGKVTIEGNEIQTTNVHHHFLNSGFYLSYPYSRYIPLNGSISEQNVPGSTPEYTGFIWPYDGYVKTIWVRSEANSGNTLMQLYKGTNGSTNGGTAMGSVTEACGAHTSVEFDFTGVTNSFSQGEGMAIKIDPTNTSQGVIVTIECVFNLTT